MHPFDRLDAIQREAHWALLYSGMRSQESGNDSILALGAEETITGNDFGALQDGPYFGYFGYEMLHQLEKVPIHAKSVIDLPEQYWFQPQSIEYFGAPMDYGYDETFAPVKVRSLQSNMTTQRYLEAVNDTVAQIHEGAFYQANITRKFYGEFEETPSPVALFKRLCQISPSPYSAIIRTGDAYILSSSPEGFLQIKEGGTVVSRPIKGSAKPEDASLASSAKDKAENLMIVDLMRNDLSRSCEPHSIKVPALYELHQFATIQQMISTVQGEKHTDCDLIDVVKGCFPPGSMTGAPKVAAMKWIAEQEQMQRGVYSGALGWLNPSQQTADLSVVIRTLVIQGNRFEFQVGGGIVADSNPQKELEETFLKARAICKLLGVSKEQLEAL